MTSLGIPKGTYDLIIGESFADTLSHSTASSSKNRAFEFNTLRFDFKPKSLASEAAYIAFDGAEDVHVIIPKERSTANDGPGNSKEDEEFTSFKGSRKPIKGEKECLLTFNQKSGALRLDKLSSNISVKKTRGEIDNKQIKSEVQLLRSKKLKDRKSKPSSTPEKALLGTKSPHSSPAVVVNSTPVQFKIGGPQHKIAPRKEKPTTPMSESSESSDSSENDDISSRAEDSSIATTPSQHPHTHNSSREAEDEGEEESPLSFNHRIHIGKLSTMSDESNDLSSNNSPPSTSSLFNDGRPSSSTEQRSLLGGLGGAGVARTNVAPTKVDSFNKSATAQQNQSKQQQKLEQSLSEENDEDDGQKGELKQSNENKNAILKMDLELSTSESESDSD